MINIVNLFKFWYSVAYNRYGEVYVNTPYEDGVLTVTGTWNSPKISKDGFSYGSIEKDEEMSAMQRRALSACINDVEYDLLFLVEPAMLMYELQARGYAFKAGYSDASETIPTFAFIADGVEHIIYFSKNCPSPRGAIVTRGRQFKRFIKRNDISCYHKSMWITESPDGFRVGVSNKILTNSNVLIFGDKNLALKATGIDVPYVQMQDKDDLGLRKCDILTFLTLNKLAARTSVLGMLDVPDNCTYVEFATSLVPHYDDIISDYDFMAIDYSELLDVLPGKLRISNICYAQLDGVEYQYRCIMSGTNILAYMVSYSYWYYTSTNMIVSRSAFVKTGLSEAYLTLLTRVQKKVEKYSNIALLMKDESSLSTLIDICNAIDKDLLAQIDTMAGAVTT